MKMKMTISVIIAIVFAVFMWPVAADVGDGLSGGGQIVDGKGKNGLKISYGGWAKRTDIATLEGEFQIVFHNVGLDMLDKAKFHGKDVVSMKFWPSDSDTCLAAMTVDIQGTLDGVPGYSVFIRAGDAGPPGHWTDLAFDTLRIELFKDDSIVYDTSWVGEFPDESSCVGGARTGQDRGNLTIDY